MIYGVDEFPRGVASLWIGWMRRVSNENTTQSGNDEWGKRRRETLVYHHLSFHPNIPRLQRKRR